jgi:hypothetical protein
MIMQDKLEKERADAKNAVEEYVYEMRSKISESLSEFIAESVRGRVFVKHHDLFIIVLHQLSDVFHPVRTIVISC